MVGAFIAVIVVFYFSWHKRANWIVVSTILMLLTIYPKTVLWPATVQYVGMAGQSPTIQSYVLVAVAAVAYFLIHRPGLLFRALIPWMPFIALSAYLARSAWPKDSLTAAGLVHLYAAIGIFAVAAALIWDRPLADGQLLYLVAGVTAVELLFVLSDFSPRPLHQPKQALAGALNGRAIGTTDHPDQLAKLAFYLLILNLLVRPTTSAQRKLQLATSVTLLTVTALTEGRAAFVGIVALVVLNALLQPSRTRGQGRFALIIGAVIVSAGAYSTLALRFKQDPAGGDRDYLATIADKVIASNWQHGVGINHFVSVVGAEDPIVGSGVPVHNTFLLSAAEMGILGAVLLWAPLLLLAGIALLRVRNLGAQGVAARAIVSAVPGFVLIASTGWGVVQSPVLELLMFVLGVAMARLLPLRPLGERERLDVEPDTVASLVLVA
jgi:predicted small integral membrane protein